MKSLRNACLVGLVLPLLAAATGQAQYNDSWGPHPAYKNSTARTPGYKSTAFGRANVTRSVNNRGNACDTGCDVGCNVGCDTGCDVGCDAAPGCGCAAGCEAPGKGGCCKVCKLVKVVVEAETTCYGVKCKDVCVPGCGSKCTHTEGVQCGGAGCDCCESGACCTVRFPTGKPGCSACVKTIKYLVKYKTTKQVCGYKWIVVDAGCGGCDACGCDVGSAPATEIEESEGDPFRDDVLPVPIPQDPNA